MHRSMARRVAITATLVSLATAAAPALAQVPHRGVSPFFPTEKQLEDDGFDLIDVAGDLDTVCRFDYQGVLRIPLAIDRFIGATDTQGRPISPRVLADKAFIVLPAYDIDRAQGEVDKIWLNDCLIGTADGVNNQWYLNTFEVDARRCLRFPAAPGAGGPTPVENTITIEIDTASDGQWCASFDWVGVKFSAMHPLVFVHGINASADAWSDAYGGIATYLTQLAVPFRADITLPNPNGRIADNQLDVRAAVNDTARRFGVNQVHLIGHSKGGLDSRLFLWNSAANPDRGDAEVKTFHTLNTPHKGSVLADLSTLRRTVSGFRAGDDPALRAYLDGDAWAARFGAGPRPPGLLDLRPAAMAQFNSRFRSPASLGIPFFSQGSDADTGADRDVTPEECAPLYPRLAHGGCRAAYSLLGRFRQVTGLREVQTTSFLFFQQTGYEPILAPWSRFELNDLAVARPSARLGAEPHWFRDANPGNQPTLADNLNHSAAKDPDAADWILAHVRLENPARPLTRKGAGGAPSGGE